MVTGNRFADDSSQPPASKFLFQITAKLLTDDNQKIRRIALAGGKAVASEITTTDGHEDLASFTYWGGIVLYHNNGDGTSKTYTEKSGSCNNSLNPAWNTGGSFLDYESDGHSDLLSNHVTFDPARAPQTGLQTSPCRYFGHNHRLRSTRAPGGTNLSIAIAATAPLKDVSERPAQRSHGGGSNIIRQMIMAPGVLTVLGSRPQNFDKRRLARHLSRRRLSPQPFLSPTIKMVPSAKSLGDRLRFQ